MFDIKQHRTFVIDILGYILNFFLYSYRWPRDIFHFYLFLFFNFIFFGVDVGVLGGWQHIKSKVEKGGGGD